MLSIRKMDYQSYAKTIDKRSSIIAEIFVDDVSDLPETEDIDGYTLCMGSIAYVIQNGELYVLGSDGVWYNSEGETPGAQIMPTTVETFNIANATMNNDAFDPVNDIYEEGENIDELVGDVESF